MKKPDRPRQSKFMGHVYRISWTKDPKTDEGDDADGLTENAKCSIELREGLPATRERETLIHEVLHQLLEGVTLPDDIDELVASQLGLRLGAHIQDNPLFWRYVTRRIPKVKDACA